MNNKLILIICFISFKLIGQHVNLLSYFGRNVINGADNKIFISSKNDVDSFQLSVLNGTIEESEMNSMVYKNKKQMSFKENFYCWKLCSEKDNLEPVIITYFKNSKKIKTDSILFNVVNPPVFEINIFRENKENTFDRLQRDSLTPVNIVGINLWPYELLSFSTKKYIEEYTISICSGNKIYKILKNEGPYITKKNKAILSEYKNGFILIGNVKAQFDCGLTILTKDPIPVYYNK